MKRPSFLFPFLLVMAVIAAIILPACNSTPPVLPGTVTDFHPCGTFGHNTAEVTSTAVADLWFNPFVAGSNTNLSVLSVYFASSSPITFEAGVYSNSSTQPGNLLAETGPVYSGPATEWITAALKQNVPLSNGVTYWLAYQSTLSQYASASIPYAYQSAGAYGTLPASFSGIVGSGYVFSIYGTTCP